MAVFIIFYENEQQLQLVKHLPAVMHLQSLLLKKCKRKIEREETEETSMEEFLKRNFNGSDVVQDLVKQFLQAWDDVRVYLKNYDFTVRKKDVQLRMMFPDEFHQRQISQKDSLSVFLPTLSKEGLCSYVLADFLIKTQNEFLQQFCLHYHISFEKHPFVKPAEVSSVHVISMDASTNLQSLAVANYHHRTDKNGDEVISFDFGGFERQLKDELICGKSRICGEIETMAYRTEMSITWSQEVLAKKVKQVPLTQSAKKRITSDFNSLPDLHDCLDNLNLTIGFLCCLDGQEGQNDSLVTFMNKGLCMAIQNCKRRHVLSLWLTIAMEKCRRMSCNKQDPFPEVNDQYKVEITDSGLKSLFNQYIQNSQRTILFAVAETLFECIVFRLSTDDNDEDGFNFMEQSIFDNLYGHITTTVFDEEIARKENVPLITEEDITSFPNEIMGKHSIPIWQWLMEVCYKDGLP